MVLPKGIDSGHLWELRFSCRLARGNLVTREVGSNATQTATLGKFFISLGLFVPGKILQVTASLQQTGEPWLLCPTLCGCISGPVHVTRPSLHHHACLLFASLSFPRLLVISQTDCASWSCLPRGGSLTLPCAGPQCRGLTLLSPPFPRRLSSQRALLAETLRCVGWGSQGTLLLWPTGWSLL